MDEKKIMIDKETLINKIMKVKIQQNLRGRYNLLGSEETLSFVMDLVDENNKCIEIDGVRARLQLNDDIDPIEDPEDNMSQVFDMCWKYSDSVWSGTDYKAQCLLFAKLFQENYETLCKNRIAQQKIDIEKEIKRLQSRLGRLYGYDDFSYEVNRACKNKIATLSKWVSNGETKLAQIKEGTDEYNKEKEKLDRYKKQLNKYETSQIEEMYYD